MLSLEEITLEVGDNSEEPRRLLDAISLQMRRGQFVGVIGPSGCGKSTLLKIIAGLTDPTDGAVRWDGRDLATEGDLPPAELGYVPQFSLAHELLTVRECVDYAARLRVDGTDADARAGRVETLLKTVGLDTPRRPAGARAQRRAAAAFVPRHRDDFLALAAALRRGHERARIPAARTRL